ncbi:KH domain-containing protein [Rhodotorula paludigena]|uniref:KH domain-containing protein n=1 Tax=Rhodotorula paludigena TaxID=86838 RepID=UPI00316B2836
MSSLERKRKWDEPADGAPAPPDSASPAHDGAKHARTDLGPDVAPHDADKAAEAAAAIAARLASQYGGPAPPGHAPPPPPPGGAGASAASPMGAGHKGERDRDREMGLFVEDIEINDLRNRYLLTKGPTQQQILADTGAAVLTKGVWYPDKSMATEKDPPLYLHITAESQDKLDAGVRAVKALIDQDLNLLDQRRFPRRDGADGAGGERDQGYGQRRKWPEEKVNIDLEPLRNFNIRAKTVGPGGLFVKYIQQETGTRVQIKGLGSGFIETDTGRESDDPLHINIAGPDPQQMEKAVELARDLLAVIREKHAEARQALQGGGGFGGGGYGGGAPGGGFQPSGANTQQVVGGRYGQPPQPENPYAYQPAQYAGAGLTAPLPPGEAPAGSAEPAGGQAASGMSAEAYTAWWNSLDQASQEYYTQYYAAYAQYAANPAAAAGATGTPDATGGASANTAPPPPPPADAAPPPPPPSSAPPPPPPPPPAAAPPPPPPPPAEPQGGSGRYGAVPPPAGL